MSSSSEIQTISAFIGETHPAFSLQFWPDHEPRKNIVYLPPFAEEMNRCRSIVARQARWFARQGYSCTILDYYGTGESHGEFEDASLDMWHENLDNVIEHIGKHSDAPIVLWGCRLGALIAHDYASQQTKVGHTLLYWQPVTSGKSYLTQTLRQRVASLMQAGKDTETTEQMRSRLAAGESIEVAGYKLGGALASGIDRLDMTQSGPHPPPTIFWLEHCAKDTSEVSMKSNRVIESLRSDGSSVEITTFTGDPIWQLHKRAECDDLLGKTRLLNL